MYTTAIQYSGTQTMLHALLPSLHPYAMPHVYDFLSSDEPKQRVSEKVNNLKPEMSVMKVMIEAELRVLDARKQTSLVLARQACMFELLFTIFMCVRWKKIKCFFKLK